jgi:hypothetical protein
VNEKPPANKETKEKKKENKGPKTAKPAGL